MPPRESASSALLCVIFAVSGASALAFEALFFRLAGLVLGNSVWAVSIVLCSFMAGLSVGSAIAGRVGDRLRAPLRVYALAELGIAVSGVGLVVALPPLSSIAAPALGWFADTPAVIGLLRLAGGFTLMIPRLGMEMSFFVLLVAYGLVGALLMLHPAVGGPVVRSQWTQRLAVLGLLAGAPLVFPFGAMDEVILRGRGTFYEKSRRQGMQLVALHEGATETALMFRKDLEGTPWYYTLGTNNHSMSSTMTLARRYMKLYVYWPMAVRPQMRSALLISYGVGSTAKALVDSVDLESIDVVDISRDILDLSDYIYPDAREHPLNDPRVNVHVEDGRFFLASTWRKFDLITAEPPPPRLSGIENLYSQEFFGLVRERLSDHGIVTYWLPVHSLRVEESKSIPGERRRDGPGASVLELGPARARLRAPVRAASGGSVIRSQRLARLDEQTCHELFERAIACGPRYRARGDDRDAHAVSVRCSRRRPAESLR